MSELSGLDIAFPYVLLFIGFGIGIPCGYLLRIAQQLFEKWIVKAAEGGE